MSQVRIICLKFADLLLDYKLLLTEHCATYNYDDTNLIVLHTNMSATI